jgi:hypothetical protein
LFSPHINSLRIVPITYIGKCSPLGDGALNIK